VPEHTIYRWKQALRAARAQASTLASGRYLEVVYEELTRDPEAELRRICSFLGLPYEPAITESSMRTMGAHQPTGEKRIVQNSQRWRSYFGPAQLGRLESIAGLELVGCGYAVTTAGDHDPARWQRAAWSVQGRVARSIIFFRTWGLKGLPGFVRSSRAALMQWRSNRG
jgi:hypothetical protein